MQDFQNIRKLIWHQLSQVSDVILFLNEKKSEYNHEIFFELFVKIVTSEKIDFNKLIKIVNIITQHETDIKPENIIFFIQGKRYFMKGSHIVEDDMMAQLSSEISGPPVIQPENQEDLYRSSDLSRSPDLQIKRETEPWSGDPIDCLDGIDKDFFEDSEGYYIESPDSPVFEVLPSDALSDYYNKLLQNPDLLDDPEI